MVKILFMGTPDFAVPAFKSLVKNHDVIAVITQPDKPVGRKKVLSASPVKKAALDEGVRVYQPAKIGDLHGTLKTLQFDFMITAAYGQIIPERILKLARIDALNLHGSILPKYRGAAPIQRAIMAGEKALGVSLMRMVKKMDAGPVYAIETIPNEGLTSGEAFSQLAELGPVLLENYLEPIAQGLKPKDQDETKVTYATRITLKDERLSWELDAKAFYQHYLAVSPTPGATIILKGQEMKLTECEYVENIQGPLKTVHRIDRSGVVIALKDGGIRIKRVKPAGKKEMHINDYLNGKPQDFLVEGMPLL